MKESDKMFSFFHRTPKIVLDCLTTVNFVYEYTPIVKATKTYPDYWKELPPNQFMLGRDENDLLFNRSVDNLKNCVGMLDFFKNGISIRHWTDLYVETTEEKYDYFISSGKMPDSHGSSQIGNGFKNYHNIKLTSPWFFREKEGINFSWIGAEWNLDQFDVKVLPAVVNFKMNHSTNINLMIPKRIYKFVLPVGQPLITLIPMSDKRVVIRNHLVSESEIPKNPNEIYFHGWRTAKKLLQDNKNSDRMCPFGF